MSYIDDEEDDFYCHICGEFSNPSVRIRGILYCRVWQYNPIWKKERGEP